MRSVARVFMLEREVRGVHTPRGQLRLTHVALMTPQKLCFSSLSTTAFARQQASLSLSFPLTIYKIIQNKSFYGLMETDMVISFRMLEIAYGLCSRDSVGE